MADGSPSSSGSRWTDERLDDRVRDAERRFQAQEKAIEGITYQVAQLGSVEGHVAVLDALLHEVQEDVRQAAAVAESARAAAQRSELAAIKGRKDTLIAVLGFAAPVTVAIIGGIVALLVGAHP